MDERRIVVTKDGPYRVEGGVPLLRTAIVQTERGEPIAWDEGPEFETPGEVYELCRCGRSSTKPFCDKTHERIPFDGTETADRGPIAQRREAWEGEANHVLYDDLSLCTHAGFCRNVRTGVWEMVEEADDPEVRAEFRAMVQRCPSGRLSFAVLPDPEPIEPTFEPSVGVEPDASYWIRGGIPVVSEDETPYEVRNRQTLCRCGQSRNKPFCDGSHKQYGFDDPALPE
ncbi:MAG TPA: CDGSH iron-sulfur domain-containing protein [Actinomycetota bacterium]|nr:CDGSH iron-sulfur domain-containing protein [Actinomycetota bacterium]